jgi:DNA-binding response OmpR family regulator
LIGEFRNMDHGDPSWPLAGETFSESSGTSPLRALLLTGRALADSLRSALENEGVLVDTAQQAALADSKVQSGDYDVVLFAPDHLPGVDDSRLLHWRRLGVTAHILVLLPDDCDSADKVRALDAGADGDLQLSVSAEELAARLRALVRRNERTDGSVFRTHDLEIDLMGRRARRGGRIIHLTSLEFDLLQVLAEHQGRVLSRSVIHQYLYPGEQNTRSNVVDVYIGYLRSKIDEGFDTPLILTRRGQGYLLRPRGS